MPKLSYDQRNVAYVNYLFETGALDDPLKKIAPYGGGVVARCHTCLRILI